MAEELTPKQAEDVLNLIDEISKFIKENQHRVPYHLNLIDEMHINENGHSRILYKLLQYQSTEGKYIFLKSLFKYIADHSCLNFGNISIDNPEILAEKERIDLWVLDSGYAVIFENKIYNAKDQEAQIARYIEKTIAKNTEKYRSKTEGNSKANIFVVYLPQTDNKDPEEQTWGEGNPYEEIRSNLYAKTSFRSIILPWLKEKVLPEISRKDEMFECAIAQYIDYLEGLFKIRESDKKLNNMIMDEIKKKIELRSGCNDLCSIENNIEALQKYREKVDEIQRYIGALEDEFLLAKFKIWKKEYYQKYYSKWTELENGGYGYTDTKKNDATDEEKEEICLEIDKNHLYISAVLEASGMQVNLQNAPDFNAKDKHLYNPNLRDALSTVLQNINENGAVIDTNKNIDLVLNNKDDTTGKFLSKVGIKDWGVGVELIDRLIELIKENSEAIEKAIQNDSPNANLN